MGYEQEDRGVRVSRQLGLCSKISLPCSRAWVLLTMYPNPRVWLSGRTGFRVYCQAISIGRLWTGQGEPGSVRHRAHPCTGRSDKDPDGNMRIDDSLWDACWRQIKCESVRCAHPRSPRNPPIQHRSHYKVTRACFARSFC